MLNFEREALAAAEHNNCARGTVVVLSGCLKDAANIDLKLLNGR
jgi:hypothetical protein